MENVYGSRFMMFRTPTTSSFETSGIPAKPLMPSSPSEEIEKYNLYYAKNQSFVLDIEILLKSLVLFMKR